MATDDLSTCSSCSESVMVGTRATRVARVDGSFWTEPVVANTGSFVVDPVAVVRP